MNGQNILSKLWLPALGVVLFLTAILCRPLIPIDETRYMSVAWEMSLHQGWLDPLTKNFEPYSHKPPLLFWLINAFWSVFGVSRWAGTIPVVLASILCVYLTGVLGKTICKGDISSPLSNTTRVRVMMAASFPFMIYGTIVMFDFLVCVFVLLSLIFVVRYSETRRITDLLLLGLCLGVGVLAKGPVTYLYVLPVYLLAPLWKPDLTRLKSWYANLLLAILVSAIPVLFWLIPVLKASDNQFAFWLVWNQTAGRITGNFTESHIRPFYFYLPLLPLFMMPWVFFPQFWVQIWAFILSLKSKMPTDNPTRFLLCCLLPVLLTFSVISGKQMHYLVPLVPTMVLLLALGFRDIQTKTLVQTLMVTTCFFVGGQVMAKHYLFEKYDLTPAVAALHQYEDRPFAFVSNYHAEFSFLARRTHKIDDINWDQLAKWFEDNPNGLAIVKYSNISETKPYRIVFTMKYRGRNMGFISKI